MRTGYWWALLVLAAVVSMHGLQCVAAGTSTPVTGVSVAVAADDPHAHAAPAHAPPAAPVEGSGHSVDHLWSVCLAVLAVGLAALTALLTGRPLRMLLPPSSVSRRRIAAVIGSLRPPDLHQLCILRT